MRFSLDTAHSRNKETVALMETSGCLDRARLRGCGEELLILVWQSAPAQLADWLRLAVELSAAGNQRDASSLVSNECCQLRRKGEDFLAVVMECASPDEWVKWLQIPLEHARLAGNARLVETILAASGGLQPAAGRATTAKARCWSASSRAQPSANRAAGGGCYRVPTAPCHPGAVQPPGPFSCCKMPPPAERFATAPPPPPPPAAAPPLCCKSPATKTWPTMSKCTLKISPTPSAVAAGSGGVNGLSVNAVGVGVGAIVDSDKLCLHRATMARDLVRMRGLIAGGVDKNATDLWACTALHRAAEQDAGEAIRLLLAAGLDVGARDMEGYSPLHFSAARGSSTATMELLAAGACVSDRGLNGDTPLHSAVRFLSLSTVRILLEADADETAENEEGHTPRDVTGVLPDGREGEGQPDPLTEQGILALLAAAPARRRYRIWKRRAWLVMLRARAQARAMELEVDAALRAGCDLRLGREGDECDDLDESMHCCDQLEQCGDGGDDNVVDGEWLGLVDQTVELAEDGVFHKIVGYL